ncbi:atp-dependent rna helicase [Ophiostoma piceae UAMH 11346]|uniref:ATP-dependent RNA helicase n=1 Tax=Ophiostoma piceae (strain UAMH 11346) TaxID=1262450 RepID=S3CRJ9_OPHP1|nr:atp-dependent rna helicase [Ophiostoma piceae UAMH 11346]
MFRTTMMRAARLPRVAAVSSSVVAGARVAVMRSAGMTQTKLVGRTVPAVSAVARFSRSYSSEATAAASTEATEGPRVITKFSELGEIGVHENIIHGLTQGMGYEKMTPVQSKAMSPALTGKDIVAQAKTGTGKTLAFLIPVIQRIINKNPDLAYSGRVRARSTDISAIIMSPTRELAEQIGKEARRLVNGTGIVVQTAVGGTQKNKMLMETRTRGCHLLVATPGRLNDLLSTPNSGIAAPNLAALVLDEADRMLDVGFSQELEEIVRQLPNRKEVPRQTLMFSATVPRDVISLARTYIDGKNFEFVQTVDPNEALTHERIPQNIIPVKGYENIHPTLLELFQREVEASKQEGKMPFKAIVFLSTTAFVRLTSGVFNELRKNNSELPRMFTIHSKLTQNGRTHAAESFRRSTSSILFSSDVTARGMDFPNVTHVIQVGIPPDREQYIHRLGRTGRAEKDGEGWIITAQPEIPLLRRILVDLPINRQDGFAASNYDLAKKDDAERPAPVTAITNILKDAPGNLLAETYMSFFGGMTQGRSMQVTADCLHDWAIKGWEWDTTPAIMPSKAMKLGLSRCRNINTGEDPEQIRQGKRNFGGDDDFAQRFSGGGGGGFSRGGDCNLWLDTQKGGG